MEEKIKNLAESESKLLEKQSETEVKLARIEERQSYMSNQIDSMHSNIISEMHRSVDGRMQDLSLIVEGQQKTLTKIIEVQGKQTQQIDGIQRTLDHFTKIEERVDDIEKKVTKLESFYVTEEELKKEKIKGRWAAIGAVVAALSSIVCALIATLA